MSAFLQNAGNQLKSLQKALKNPLGNAGVLAGELSKRAKRLRHTTRTPTPLCCDTLSGCCGNWSFSAMQEGGFEHRSDAAGQRASGAGKEWRPGACPHVWPVLLVFA